MKKKYRLKRKVKITGVIFITLICVAYLFAGGFNTLKTAFINAQKYLAGEEKLGEKNISPNKIGEQFDGTYKLSLTVTGDASTDKTVSSANVLVVFDTSNSMSDYRSYIHMAYDTGRYGLVNGQYINLYSAQNRNSQLNNDTFAGTVYVRNGNSYTVYTGQRYVQTRRADAGEKVIYDFTQDLFSYQDKENNPENIQMALISFNHTAHEIQDWTSNEDDITGKLSSTGLNGTKQIENSSGTNYEVALQSAINDYLSTADGDPTFVIFFTDGAPTQVEGTANGVYDAPEDCYGPAKDEALTIQRYDTSKHEADANSSNTTLYGIYAYGNEADYLDDIIYYAHNNGVSRDNERPETDPTDYYYNASDTAALTAAVKDIFSDIVDTLGISNVSIKDGTTTNVQTSQGISHLLTIDENSYEYWLSIPITNNEMKRVDVASGEEYPITLRDNGDGTFKASSSKWDDVTITGKIEDGVFKYKWTESNNFYKFNPPRASFNSSTGYVDWNLASVGTLLDGVTYEVTFDVYPSQETYDLIADLKNDKIDYDTEVDPAIKQYLHKNGNSYSLDTNTRKNGKSTATITYTDTRTDDGEKTYTYTNPEPVATDASSISIQKTWENALDSREHLPVNVNLQRDGENFYPAELNSNNGWKADNIAIAVGLARLDGETLTVLDTGHDYKFAELGSESYNWELQTETVHPMLINGEIKKLILVEDESTIPSAMGDKTYYDGYYKLGNKYYKDEGTNPTIHAINHRRSNLNIKKVVNGENANPNDEFEFTITVTQKDEKDQEIADNTSTTDDDLWFSVYNNGYVDLGNRLVSSGWQKSVNEKGEIYYHAPNKTQLVVKLKNNENLRFVNVVSNTDFTVVEGNTANYELESITASGFSSAEGGKDGYLSTGNTITGNIGKNNKSYQVEYTNKNTNPEKIKVEATKTWDDKDNQDGKRPTSVKFDLKDDEGKVVKTIELDGTIDETGEADSWKAIFENLPKYKDGKEITYTVEEQKSDVLTGKDGAGTYEIITEGDYKTGYNITNRHTPELIDVSVIKVWDDAEDHDGFRPDELTVNLSNGDSVTLNENNGWEATLEDLPKYTNGQENTYTWTESALPEGYTLTGNTTTGYVTTLTNSYEPKYTEATVKKVWDDKNDQDGKRPDELTVKLSNGASVTLNEGNSWTATIDNLPQYKDGQEITYTWTESETGLPEGYKLTDTSKSGTITTFTNSYTPEVIKVEATKTWDDKNDQDGKRPISVKFDLKDDEGKVVKTIELDGTIDENGEADSWKAVFENLPKYKVGLVGIPATYKVEEQKTDVLTGTDGPGTYEINTEGDYEAGYKITNKHTPEVIKVEATKTWNDKDNQDGKRPTSVKFDLKDSDGKVVKTIELDGTKDENGEADSWKAVFENLPKYKDKTEITYTVEEQKTDVLTGKDGAGTYEIITEGDYKEGYTITNKHTPEVIKVEATKTWDDKDNQDGKRPTSVKFDLKDSDGKVVKTIELDGTKDENGEADSWKAVFENLPKYKDKTEITYTVEEQKTDVLTGEDGPGTYEIITEGDYKEGYTITNKHTPETTETTVKKVWEDANNQDGKRPDKIVVSLSNGTSHQLDESMGWTKTISGLPKYADGKEITYTWTESEEGLPEGYKLTGNEVKGTTTTLTNSYTPEVTSATIKKVWDDAKNQDGIRPDTLTVTLTANGKKPQAVVLNEGNQWEATITGLPKKANGVDIKYEWTEGSLPEGYEMTDSSTEGTVTTITNKHTPETIEVTAKKVWNDNNDQDGFRPDSVKFDLKVGDAVIDTIELDGTKDENGETDAWTATFKNLPKYEAGKVKVAIEYSVEEQTTEVLTGEDGPGTYDIITEGDQDKGYTITNKHTPELTEATVTKKWNDANNKDGKRQTTLDVVLKAGDTVVAEKVLSDENNWTVTVKDLPKYADGKEISYTWSEGEIQNGYKQSHTEIDGNNKTITNAETTFVCVKKVWDDDKDRDGLRPGTLRVTLSDGKFVDLNEGNGWFARIDDLYKYNEEDNTEINYTWKEADVDNYELTGNSKEAELTTLTNTHNIATTEATVIKDWQDANNQDGIRPETLKVTLSAENDSTFKDQEVTLAEGNNWTATIKNLPKYTDKGNTEVKYKWTEEKLPKGYEMTGTKISGTTTTITNTHVPELIDIPVKKVWVNNGPYDFPNPTEVRVKLVENGTVVDTATLSATNNWSAVFTELPKYRPKSVGDEIPYTVIEEPVLDYDTSITGKISDGFTITNTYNPTPTSVEVTKTWDDASDQDGLRPTSIFMTLIGTVNGDVVYKTEAKEVIGGKDVNTWKYTFDKLPLRYVGQEIEWKVTETLEDGSVYTGESVTDLEIKNSYDPQQITLDVSKDWQDSNNNDGKRPAEITVHLLQDGTEIASYVLTEAEGWTHRFGPYPKFRDHGTPISYIIVEDPVADYENTNTIYTTDSLEYTAQVINTHENETIDIPVVKTWIDENNKYKVRPESITIRLLGDGQEVAVAKLTAATGWKHTFTKLLKYNNGEEISYTITEDEVLNYSTKIDGFNVTNTYNGPTGKTEIDPPNTMVEATTSSNDANLFALVYAIILGLTGLIFKKEANS